MKNSTKKINNSGFLDHLVELRSRLLYIIGVILVCLLALMPFANDIYTVLAKPLFDVMPENSTMIAVDVASPFLAPFKLVFLMSVAITIPFTLYQLWAFIAPGLYENEKKLVAPVIIFSTGLFYAGMCFAYFIVFPLVFNFFTTIAPEGVEISTDISSFLNFVIKMFFAFGLAFEVPILTLLIIKFGLSTHESLRKKRPYIVVGAFVVGMLLTPPDVISQVLLAIPIWILFELGLFLSKFITNPKMNKKDQTSKRFDKIKNDDLDSDEY